MNNSKYGECGDCNAPLQAVWFLNKSVNRRTGVTRYLDSVDYLICPHCQESLIVDDSFDIDIGRDNYYKRGGK